MRIHLVDGTYELFRGHFGAPPARSPDGQEVGATRGLGRQLMGLIRRERVSHLACAFDRVIESFRNGLFPGYKTGEGLEPELRDQFPLAEELVAALGIRVWPMVEFEADDALATAAARYSAHDEVDQVCIASPDKDLAQCVVGNQVVCLDVRRELVYDEALVQEKFGVPPASIPDYLALVGDAADGIPGIPRWGAKSSAAVLSEYGSLEEIPHDPEQWSVKVRGAGSLARELAQAGDEAHLYKQLATLRRDVPLEESVEDLEWRGPDLPRLEAVCARLGDTRLRDQALELAPA